MMNRIKVVWTQFRRRLADDILLFLLIWSGAVLLWVGLK
ncbi:hypothetical protein SAMN04488499_10667 [Sporomusa acidovorans]|nr:hypothetical protein SPACI_16000 [Sporomusa acidovorans DSM 3132]SDF65978.1 hypothetical protein SAMN04488499_10667 [Sporomusa acidovorans]